MGDWGRAALMALQTRRVVISSVIAAPYLVIMRVLSRLGEAAGVLVVVVAGLDGLEAFLEANLT